MRVHAGAEGSKVSIIRMWLIDGVEEVWEKL